MGNHRKINHLRRIAVAVIAVGTVGVPSVAMACTDWPNGGGEQISTAAARPASTFWRGEAAWDHDWSGVDVNAPASAAPRTAAAASPSTIAAPQHRTTAPKHRHPAPKHWHAAPSGTTTTAAPRPWTTKAPRPPQTATPTTPSTPSTPAAPSTPTSAAPTSTAPTATSTPSPTASASGDVARVVQLVNAERGKVGCPALTLNATLTKAAQAHSADMASHRNMSHTGSDGSDPGERITAAGYTWSTYGENVAYGYAGPEQVMAGWMASPGHKANILNCSFKEIGVGLAEPDSYWTQDFGTAR
ncbi:CAP domain-containing protein [Streptomyces sp. NPDC059582]|uniref:CAP domain-containing protein n=1 Tax=Streptomyces sp. NPDC059582 TaxID=3346875 RepID=UPI0036B4BD1B